MHRHRRTASLRSLAQSIRVDPPSRAGPRSPCPFGRSQLSAGEAAWTGDLGSWAGVGPAGANCPPHTPNLAGHPRKPPQAIAHTRAFRKVACPGSAPRPRINARLPWKREGRTRVRSLEAARQHRAVASGREARRTAPPPEAALPPRAAKPPSRTSPPRPSGTGSCRR